MGLIEAVCVVHGLHPDGANRSGETAIDKRPVAGRVAVRQLGLQGDRQMDTDHHGGRDQAVYAYAAEDAQWWAAHLDQAVPPGQFGENLRTTGLDVTGAVIGERWQVGAGDGTLLEVTSPRVPCSTFQNWMQQPRWVKRFAEHGAPGAYLRVVTEGSVGAGDPVEVVHRPEHAVTVADCFLRLDADRARRLLGAEAAGQVDLGSSMREHARAAAARD